MADNLAGIGRARGLRVVDFPGQRADDVTVQMGAVGRGQRGAFLAPEIIMHDKIVVVLGEDQIDTGSLEVRVEQQMRVRDHDRIRGSMRVRRIEMDVRMIAGAVSGRLGVNAADVVQRGTIRLLIFI